jgi:hypothetical protein
MDSLTHYRSVVQALLSEYWLIAGCPRPILSWDFSPPIGDPSPTTPFPSRRTVICNSLQRLPIEGENQDDKLPVFTLGVV